MASCGPGIAVAVGVAEGVALGVKQDIIDAPGIGADARDGQAARGGFFDAVEDLGLEMGEVPVEMLPGR